MGCKLLMEESKGGLQAEIDGIQWTATKEKKLENFRENFSLK